MMQSPRRLNPRPQYFVTVDRGHVGRHSGRHDLCLDWESRLLAERRLHTPEDRPEKGTAEATASDEENRTNRHAFVVPGAR